MTTRTDASLYDVLEVSANASFDEIEASYQRILSYMSVDSLAVYSMLDEDEVGRMRSQVEEAHRTLTDPARRAAYDRSRGGDPSDYPSVLVPHGGSDASLSFGVMGSGAEDSPAMDVDAIFKNGGAIPDNAFATVDPEPSYVEPEPPPRREAIVPPRRPPQVRQPPAPRGVPQRVDSQRRRRLQPNAQIETGPDTEFSGSLLRRLRESASADLDEVAEITKISKRYLAAIEENDFESLPATVYVRGFVAEYARVLGLDPQRVAHSYMSLYKRYRGEGV